MGAAVGEPFLSAAHRDYTPIYLHLKSIFLLALDAVGRPVWGGGTGPPCRLAGKISELSEVFDATPRPSLSARNRKFRRTLSDFQHSTPHKPSGSSTLPPHTPTPHAVRHEAPQASAGLLSGQSRPILSGWCVCFRLASRRIGYQSRRTCSSLVGSRVLVQGICCAMVWLVPERSGIPPAHV